MPDENSENCLNRNITQNHIIQNGPFASMTAKIRVNHHSPRVILWQLCLAREIYIRRFLAIVSTSIIVNILIYLIIRAFCSPKWKLEAHYQIDYR
ncbi:Piso0_000237 [Millerozyma farinosa CBS 7064]|uniref:Piso0_000237 protein n=1 Tax=Pichia sorbitophila (strain ATCC MYA-4447 / BCRC 22081 / CBS 7064 / NBRC 10061 / NRRL Y-12695) TaxID=559304 RepID=G8YTF8_PICSO|nr:Piso0_000237 [Millerozyma farinosa CBS 7064]